MKRQSHINLCSKLVPSINNYCFLLFYQFILIGSCQNRGLIVSAFCGRYTYKGPYRSRYGHNKGKQAQISLVHKMTADTNTNEPGSVKNSMKPESSVPISNRLFLSHINYKSDDQTSGGDYGRNLSTEEVRQKLEELFSKFGSVLEIYLSEREDPEKSKDNSRPPFGFIAMETAQEAQRALEALASPQKQGLFQNVAPAHVHKSKNNKQNKNERLRLERRKEYRERFTAINNANVICQVHTSHLDRLQEFSLSMPGVNLVGSFSAQKGTSFLFLRVDSSEGHASHSIPNDEPLETFSGSLWDTWFVAPNLNRVTLLSDSTSRNLVEGNIRKGVVPAIFQSLSEIECENVSLRIAIFPPKLQRVLLEGLEDYNERRKNDENDCCKSMEIQFSPGNPTHTISIVQIHSGVVVTPKSKGNNEKALYAIGRLEGNTKTRKRSHSEDSSSKNDNKFRFQQQRTSQVPQQLKSESRGDVISKTLAHNSNLKAIGTSTTPRDGNAVESEDDKSISRAYWKLQEAWERYKYKAPSLLEIVSNDNEAMWALDCGAAPGGWTKFLFRPGVVDRIYAVDPGKLAREVAHGLDETNKSKSPIVQHVDTTIQKALPGLASELKAAVERKNRFLDIWVSDMCVKDMPGQIDYFLQARSEGVVGPGTFFVLTLKCTLGYSATAFDQQTEQQVRRLDGISRDIHVVHLFSNRSSERTVIGYLV